MNWDWTHVAGTLRLPFINAQQSRNALQLRNWIRLRYLVLRLNSRWNLTFSIFRSSHMPWREPGEDGALYILYPSYAPISLWRRYLASWHVHRWQWTESKRFSNQGIKARIELRASLVYDIDILLMIAIEFYISYTKEKIFLLLTELGYISYKKEETCFVYWTRLHLLHEE